MRSAFAILVVGLVFYPAIAGAAYFGDSSGDTAAPSSQLKDVDLSLKQADASPKMLDVQGGGESVYAPPSPPSERELVNQGGVNLDLRVVYATDYVFRGIDRSNTTSGHDAPNLQLDGSIHFNIGAKSPNPFVGVFVNVFNSDPISRFQEIRPYFGFELTLKPFIFEAGHRTFIYPEREELNTSEGYLKVTLMDEWVFRMEKPLLRPFVTVAYDYDKYNGYYAEGGVEHVFTFERTGLTVTLQALVAYSRGYDIVAGPQREDNGLQRYQVGLVAEYSLNNLLNIPQRWGHWSFVGFINYTDAIDKDLTTDTTIWGGGGIDFRY
jgi:hypothetical protein